MYQPIISLGLSATQDFKKLGILYVEDVDDPKITSSAEWQDCRGIPPMHTAKKLQQDDQRKHISTTIDCLDDLLNGGFSPGQICELCGDTGTGKTQLCFQICVNHLIKTTEDRNEVLFISTNNNFASQRIREITMNSDAYKKLAANKKDDFCRSLEGRLHFVDVCDMTEFLGIVKHLEQWTKNKKLSILIVDSIFMPFKSIEINDRKKFVYRVLKDLQILAEKSNFAIVVTNNLTTSSEGVPVCLGDSYYHRINTRIMLTRKKKDTYGATVLKSVLCPEKTVEFGIS